MAIDLDLGRRHIDGNRIPNGFQQITDVSASSALTVPAGSRFAIIQPETKSVRFRDDGTAPTATVGNLIEANGMLFYTGDLSAIRIIETAASAKLNVSYYK